MVRKLKLGWTVKEVIGMGIVNPRGIDPFYNLAVKIRDFCYRHSSKEEMRDFVSKMLIKYPHYIDRIKDEILKICPQYEEMIDKFIILV
jgi:hypothetical protein